MIRGLIALLISHAAWATDASHRGDEAHSTAPDGTEVLLKALVPVYDRSQDPPAQTTPPDRLLSDAASNLKELYDADEISFASIEDEKAFATLIGSLRSNKFSKLTPGEFVKEAQYSLSRLAPQLDRMQFQDAQTKKFVADDFAKISQAAYKVAREIDVPKLVASKRYGVADAVATFLLADRTDRDNGRKILQLAPHLGSIKLKLALLRSSAKGEIADLPFEPLLKQLASGDYALQRVLAPHEDKSDAPGRYTDEDNERFTWSSDSALYRYTLMILRNDPQAQEKLVNAVFGNLASSAEAAVQVLAELTPSEEALKRAFDLMPKSGRLKNNLPFPLLRWLSNSDSPTAALLTLRILEALPHRPETPRSPEEDAILEAATKAFSRQLTQLSPEQAIVAFNHIITVESSDPRWVSKPVPYTALLRLVPALVANEKLPFANIHAQVREKSPGGYRDPELSEEFWEGLRRGLASRTLSAQEIAPLQRSFREHGLSKSKDIYWGALPLYTMRVFASQKDAASNELIHLALMSSEAEISDAAIVAATESGRTLSPLETKNIFRRYLKQKKEHGYYGSKLHEVAPAAIVKQAASMPTDPLAYEVLTDALGSHSDQEGELAVESFGRMPLSDVALAELGKTFNLESKRRDVGHLPNASAIARIAYLLKERRDPVALRWKFTAMAQMPFRRRSPEERLVDEAIRQDWIDPSPAFLAAVERELRDPPTGRWEYNNDYLRKRYEQHLASTLASRPERQEPLIGMLLQGHELTPSTIEALRSIPLSESSVKRIVEELSRNVINRPDERKQALHIVAASPRPEARLALVDALAWYGLADQALAYLRQIDATPEMKTRLKEILRNPESSGTTIRNAAQLNWK